MVDGVFVELMPNSGWRIMLGLGAIPGIVMYFGFLYLPESPRWLAMQGQSAAALVVLKSLRESDQDAEEELEEILQSVATVEHHGSTSRSEPNGTVEEDDYADDEEDDDVVREYGTALPSAPVARNDSEEGVISQLVHMITDAPLRRALVLGCGLMVVQQCCGINT